MEKYSREHLIELDKKHFIHPTTSIKQQQTHGASFIFSEGNGIYLKDMDGRQVIDGMSSLWNVNIGHGRQELAEVAYKQMGKMAYSSAFSTFSHEPAIILSEKIASLAPGDLSTVFFTSGGSESNDSAIKLVRHYWRLKGRPERMKIISRKKAYHGVSTGATSLTGIPEFWEMAGSVEKNILYADVPNCEIQGHTPPVSGDKCACGGKIRQLIETEGPETIAAFLAEPIQGAGGLIFPSDGYMEQVRQICNEYGIIFIIDEVITGFGRTGKMFGMDNWSVVPDVMTMAKGITSGYIPLGGVVLSEKMHKNMIELSTGTLFHGFTYSGHPTACAVALKNIEIIEREGLVDNSKNMGQIMLDGFESLERKFDIVTNTRAKGLLGAFDLRPTSGQKDNFPTELQVAANVVALAAEKGLICRSVTYEGMNTIVLAPPLIINENQIGDVIQILEDSISEIRNKLAI
ncbi:aspartate aminotransferase family protein [Neobacillus sp. NPDC097160]|uniref:aminotransferase family protein n=1 Tax=Neobacillus sp. NPDC097160 TaxID=3364298 RepID=UPI00380CB1B4